MKLLLVNNDGDTWQELLDVCIRCGYDVTPIRCLDIRPGIAEGFDLVVLSGGYWYDDQAKHLEVYRNEMALIREATVPILGICLGFQLMHAAFSGELPLLDKPQTGLQDITVTSVGQALFHLPPRIRVHKNHTRGVVAARVVFEVLATSPGHIEIMRHITRPLLGVQYHPEIGDAASTARQFRMLADGVIHAPIA